MSPESKQKLDCELLSRVLSTEEYSDAETILTYVSTEIEVDTKALINAALQNNKRVAVPMCIKDETSLDFYYINSFDDLTPGTFGVLEPDPLKCEKLIDFSSGLCIVPGLSFDTEGYRLGYGKGYYDRFLSKFKGITVGLCYVYCIKLKLPHGYYDKPVDILITDKYIRRL